MQNQSHEPPKTETDPVRRYAAELRDREDAERRSGVTSYSALPAADFTPKRLELAFPETTHAGKRAAFYRRLAAEPDLRDDVRICYDNRPQYAGAGLALNRVVGFFRVSLVDLVLFLKNPTPAELAIIEAGREPTEGVDV